jgi:hypothetical protein
MAEVLLNTNSPVRLKIYWKGQPSDADSNPIVKIYDVTEDPAISPNISPTSLLQTITSTRVETDEGVYEAYPPLSLTTRNRTLKFLWQYDIDGESITKEEKVFCVTPYTDITQAQYYLGFGSDPSDPNYKTYDEILAAEKYARSIIEDYTGQKFYTYDDSYTVYGSGADLLPLPYRINSLHELYQNDILLEDTINSVSNWTFDVMIAESGYALRVNRADVLDNTVYTANGLVPPSINDRGYGAFIKNYSYRVQGKFGWESVPDEVEQACLQLMGHYFDKDRYWKDQYLKSVQTFDWKFEYTSDISRGTGCAYADKLLSSYVLNQMVVI